MDKEDDNKTSEQLSYDKKLADQKREDVLREQENIRRWLDEDAPRPTKTSCNIGKHIISKEK